MERRRPPTMADVLRARGKLGPYGPAEDPPPSSVESVTKPNGVELAAVRAWAATNGIEVGTRGRIPTAVIERYREARDGVVDLH